MYGNQDTANPHKKPQTRNKRGNQTSRSIAFNSNQADLFPLSREHLQQFRSRNENKQTLWVLLFYVDKDTRTVQYELSRPINMTEAGKVDDWEPRFIMPTFHVDQPSYNGPDLSPDIDIPVTERS
ncbi:hypothetical protein C4F51_10310 [Cellvibrio sp. KB43]|uniref:Uncharacterized protein n=1 Tax=Cellvibrio polysaccharolyticus TaxID=2082724 RepID=A0A928YU53_9GAMM|nr:hypothetical protein [Cellvibrio polysaccharolyticus]